MDLQTYTIRRNNTHSTSASQTSSTMLPPATKKSSKYIQVCDNTTMTDENNKTYTNLYQNIGTIQQTQQLLDDQTPTSTSSSISTLRHQQQNGSRASANNCNSHPHHSYLQRTLSDPHCPSTTADYINSSEELLDGGAAIVYDDNTSTSINKNQYYYRPKSRNSQKYSSEQNIVHTTHAQIKEILRLDNHHHDPIEQFSLDRKLIRKPSQFYNTRNNTLDTSSSARTFIPKFERKGASLSLQRQKSSPTRNPGPRNYIPCTKSASEKSYQFGRSQSYILQKSMDNPATDNGGFFFDRNKQYNSLRRNKDFIEELDAGAGFLPSSTTEFITHGVGSGSGSKSMARSSTGSSRCGGVRGNVTSESELDDDPEMIFDLTTAGGGHLIDCQCAHIGYSASYHQLHQKEHCFPPAPDVTRRLQSGTIPGATTANMSGNTCKTPTAIKQEVTFYRSSLTPATCSNSSSSAGSSSRIDLSQRHWWVIVTVLLLAAAAGVGVPIAMRISAGASLEERMEFASRLLQEVPLIDGHNDLPWNIRKFLHNRLKDFKFGDDLRNISPWSQSAWSHTDLPRLKQGHVAAQFWAAYVPCESQHRDAVQLTLEQIDVIRRFTEQYHPQLTLCTSAEEIRVAHQRHQLCSLIGVEGGHSLANSLAVLRTLYQVGVRYLTLTSTCNTPWADCSLVDIPGRKSEHNGLTNFGKTIVKEMNRLGMIVDLSHVSVRTMRDALAVSKAPVIFSHSSAHALCNSTRNVPDATLRKLALNRGIVMVNFYSQFLTCKDVATVADAVAHINHIRDVAGVDNVGLGAGYDGINYTPKGLEDVSSYPALFAELIGSGGWSTDDLKKLAGLNFLRVMTEVERVRDEFRQAKVPPYEDLSPRVKNTNCSSHELF
ncbi:uncharacterized protein LOC123293787 [Chrysoperla carnea]|uniref:uncharacterized protein LOC123293787 n=1 Tax=Chrysoperla carnea TaxID=189513 RepID=UPI001D08D5A6|nr:uncharacterized protein LOC123293787 [Chrysoperla carnea]